MELVLFSLSYLPPFKLLCIPHIDTVPTVHAWGFRQSVGKQRPHPFEECLIKTFGKKVWAGLTAAPRERAVSRPSALRGLSVAWRGRPSDWLAALGLEGAG